MTQRRSQLFGRRDYDPSMHGRQPILNAPAIVVWTILALIAAFAALVIAPPAMVDWAVSHLALIPARYGGAGTGGAPFPPAGPLDGAAPFVTHMLLHASLLHLGFNALWLLVFGTPTARRLGRRGGLAGGALWMGLFLVGGAAGAGLHVALYPDSPTPLVGASGGVSALMGAAIRFALRRPSPFDPEHPPLAPLTDRTVMLFSGVWIVLNLVFGLVPLTPMAEGASIAWEAHLGGYLFGLLTYPLFDRGAGRLLEEPANDRFF